MCLKKYMQTHTFIYIPKYVDGQMDGWMDGCKYLPTEIPLCRVLVAQWKEISKFLEFCSLKAPRSHRLPFKNQSKKTQTMKRFC